MSGGGSSPPAQPATTTQIQDIPPWEQGYVTNLLGQAQTIAAQPYQQFPGQQVAGFTPDQLSAFQNVEGLQGNINPLQQAATGQASAGANTANNIYAAGSPLVNASTVAASPLGIASYISPYENNVVQGIQNEADTNWNQNIMPGINNEFTGSGQGMSGREAQVLGQAAGNFQTGLSSNIANALESGYGMAGNQAATEAGILGNAGSTLGNLTATQAGEQATTGGNLQNIAGAQNTNATNNTQALQAVGQQQQQLNQTNLDTAQSNWQNQVNWPASQTEYLNQIIRGLPAPSATTSSTQTTPAYSVSPLSAVGGTGASALGLLSAATGKKRGGLIKGYAGNDGSSLVGEDDPIMEGSGVPLDVASAPSIADLYNDDPNVMAEYVANGGAENGQNSALPPKQNPLADASSVNDEPSIAVQMADTAASPEKKSPLAVLDKTPAAPAGLTESEMQRDQLLALARGMLTPSLSGSTAAAMGQGLGNMQDVQMKEREMMMNQNNLNYQREMQNRRLNMEEPYYKARTDFYQNKAENPVGVGAYDTMARGLMQDNPNLNYQDALAQVMQKNVKPADVASPSPASPLTDKDSTPAPIASSGNSQTPSNGRDEKFLSTQPPVVAGYMKQLADGLAPFPTGYQMKSNPDLKKAADNVLQYDPTYSQQRYGALKGFNQSIDGRTMDNYNTGSLHLAALKQATTALQNGDTMAFNKASNWYAAQTGSPLPTNVDGIKQLVAGELIKASTGSKGALGDRDEINKNVSTANSPEQLNGTIENYRGLMRDRMDATELRYQKATHGMTDFRSRILPQARQFMYPEDKIMTQHDIDDTAAKVGKSADQIRKDAIAKGYTIQ